MNEIPILPRKIKTGGDPRKQTDYAALHDELSKLTHPAHLVCWEEKIIIL